MKVLLDEVSPVAVLRQALHEPHDVDHLFDRGWRRVQNGELLTLAEGAGYDVKVTLDSNMPFQQTVAGRRIALVVLRLGAQGKAAVPDAAGENWVVFETIDPGSVLTIDRRSDRACRATNEPASRRVCPSLTRV